MKIRSLRVLAVAVGLCFSLASVVAPADATSSSGKWKLHGGDTFQVNAWHCGTYARHCSWTTSTKLLGTHPVNAAWIQNKAILQAHGFHASITVSKDPSATFTQSSKSEGVETWRNHKAWISDLSGKMSPSWTTVYVSTRSCGVSKVNGNITVSQKCVYAGAA